MFPSAIVTGGNWSVTRVACYNATTGAPQAPPPAGPAALNITFTAADRFDLSAITNFSVEGRQGSNLIFNFTTRNGTIPVSNITNGIGSFYNLTFLSDQSPTGFTQITYNNVNISNQNFQGNLTPNAPVGPSFSLNINNFFSSLNTSIISLGKAGIARLNISFSDDIRLFGYEFNITKADGSILLNFTNISLSGTLDNLTRIIDVRAPQGYYTASITVWDSHTAEAIPEYKVDKFLNTITFQDKITITAPLAISSGATKKKDSYEFEFDYIPFIAPDEKVFVIESIDGLEYVEDSQYRGHFVDWKNKHWIDFEGEGELKSVTKINDKKYEVTITQEGNNIKLKSIGGLNSYRQDFVYYLSNASVSWFIPFNTYQDSFFNSSYTASLNVTGDARNRTQFYLSNSSYGLVQSQNISNNGTGSYLYQASFNSLTDHTYYLNASNYDEDTGIFNITGLTLYNIIINNCTPVGTSSVIYTVRDENNNSMIPASLSLDFDYTHSTKTGSKSYTDSRNPSSNFTVCIWPTYESVNVDYTIIYSATTYPERRYSATGSIFDNITQNINLYLLSEDDGIYGRFKIVDQYGTPLTGAIGVMKLSGTSTIVEQEESDGAGLMTFFLDPNQDYDFTFSLDGYQTTSTTLRVTTTEIYTIALNSAAAAQTQPLASGIVYKFLPSTTLDNNTVYTFSFNLTSQYWNISNCYFDIGNGTILLNTSVTTFNSSRCVGILRLNTLNQKTLITYGSIYINGTNITYQYQYSVKYNYQGDFSLKTFIDDIGDFAGAGFGDFGRFIIALSFIFGMVVLLYSQSNFIDKPDNALLVIWGGVFFFSYLGWMTIPYENFPNVGVGGEILITKSFLQQYMVFTLISMIISGLMMKRNN